MSTITKSFFREHLIQEGHIQDISWLIKISAAQGLEISYVGYIEYDMGFLIVKDPVGTPLVERKKLAPGVIGSNIFRDIKNSLAPRDGDLLQKLEAAGAHAWAQSGHMC